MKYFLQILAKEIELGLLREKSRKDISLKIPSCLHPISSAYLSLQSKSPCLIVCGKEKEAKEVFSDMSTFGIEARLFPSYENYPLEKISPSPETISLRHRALQELEEKNITLVISVPNLMRMFPPRNQFNPTHLCLRKKETIDIYLLREILEDYGFSHNYQVEKKGEYSSRGNIFDIFPPDFEFPFRIEFEGDEILSLRVFSISSQGSLKDIEEALVFPIREIKHSLQTEKVFNGLFRDFPLLKGERFYPYQKGAPGIEAFLPVLYKNSSNILDYFPGGGTLFFLNHQKVLEKSLLEMDNYEKELKKEIGEEKFPEPSYYHLSSLADLHFGKTKQVKLLKPDFSPEEGFYPDAELPPLFGTNLEKAVLYLKELKKDGFKIVVVLKQGYFERFQELLEDNDIYPKALKPGETLKNNFVHLFKSTLSNGFVLKGKKIAVLTQRELFIPFLPVKKRKQKTKVSKRAFFHIKEGDYVVHESHGIGMFRGFERITVLGFTREYLNIKYRDGYLKIPVEQLERITKYIGKDAKEPKISKLGGKDWEKVKRKAKKAAKKLAIDLMGLYAEREAVSGYSFSKDTNWQKELEDSFIYTETPDQLEAIKATKKDMEKEKPMDRIVLGDVGFGKTEVAVRAAFKAVLDGKQVAMLVPTTILAQQHFNTFMERLAPFPVVVEVVSRFKKRKEQEEIAKKFNEGLIDILIGTHRVLSPDIKPRDLGLLIIDEEHRFGVGHKEKLKVLKKEVDVLTLSATPIPRTLQMALSGIRDLSTIETPPEDRLPIITYVGPYDENIVINAIRRELERGGQAYIVHNRIGTINKYCQYLKKLLPEVSFGIAHGRMGEKALERSIIDFMEKKNDVLICTTIIESGIDLSNVNSLIVDGAERLGLAQAYQIRGRVGRSDVKAYAYFFYRSKQVLSKEALSRLETISEMTELGAGFKVALKDLEIRGAGALLGKEQHGYIANVGFEYYLQLLEGAVTYLKGEKKETIEEVKINIPIDYYLPSEYIANKIARMDIYRELSSLKTFKEVEEKALELKDRFGSYPVPVKNLLNMIKVKIICRQVGIYSINYQTGRIILRSRNWRKLFSEIKNTFPDFNYRENYGFIDIGTGKIFSFFFKLADDIIALFCNKKEEGE